ncbi:MAG TPA: hypothetical protein VFZ28_12865 [Burkholderiaceae bacterium]|nr:hypothetical protein [Burkholderiaceae bacterium]
MEPLPRNEGVGRSPRDAWYRQGIVWLAAAVFALSIAGCIWLLVVGQRYADPPLPIATPQVLKVPVARPPAPEAPS